MDSNVGDEPRRLAAQARIHLSRASMHLERGDVTEAADNAWTAATHIIKAMAQKRGWPHDSHGQRIAAMSRATEETDDMALWHGYAMARGFSEEYYVPEQSDLDERTAALYLASVTEFIQQMRALIEDE